MPHPRSNFKPIFHNQCLADLFHSRSEYSSLPIKFKPLNLCYLNRLGRLELRPERNGSEIGLHDAFRMRIAGAAEFTTATIVPGRCVSILSSTFVESLEVVVLRLCGRFIQRRF